jgi:hypothetical protein
MDDPDYDEIDRLIDTDPIELGRRLRTALAEVARLGRVNDRLADRMAELEAETRWQVGRDVR